jgi:hypothetical protein
MALERVPPNEPWQMPVSITLPTEELETMLSMPLGVDYAAFAIVCTPPAFPGCTDRLDRNLLPSCFQQATFTKERGDRIPGDKFDLANDLRSQILRGDTSDNEETSVKNPPTIRLKV